MKLRIAFSAFLLTVVIATATSNASAQPWRGCHRGWCRPRVGVSVGVGIPAPVIAPPVVVGGYYGPRYYGPRYYRPYYRPYRHNHRYYR